MNTLENPLANSASSLENERDQHGFYNFANNSTLDGTDDGSHTSAVVTWHFRTPFHPKEMGFVNPNYALALFAKSEPNISIGNHGFITEVECISTVLDGQSVTSILAPVRNDALFGLRLPSVVLIRVIAGFVDGKPRTRFSHGERFFATITINEGHHPEPSDDDETPNSDTESE